MNSIPYSAKQIANVENGFAGDSVTGDGCISISIAATRVERMPIVVCGGLDDDRMLLRTK